MRHQPTARRRLGLVTARSEAAPRAAPKREVARGTIRTVTGRRAALLGLALMALGLVAGCDEKSPAPPASVRSFAATPTAADAKLAYSHTLAIDLPAARLAAHFRAARDRCLTDGALHCLLLESQIEMDPRGVARPRARIEVRLPHAAVPVYVAAVMAALPGEPATAVVVRAQATRAEDLGRPIEDGERRLAQLTDYRTRLAALAARSDIKVDDLIKIAGETSRVQAEIEAATAAQRMLAQRVATEALSVSWESDVGANGMWAPVRDTWRRGGALLGESAGDALRFAIVALPWIPIAVIAVGLLRWAWRRRRKPA